jgi:hypothetical protein
MVAELMAMAVARFSTSVRTEGGRRGGEMEGWASGGRRGGLKALVT